MKDSENNIKFNYLYRDAGNYKVYGSQIFSNPDRLNLEDIEGQIRSVLIDGEFFEPLKWGLRALRFLEWIDDLDHYWNEF